MAQTEDADGFYTCERCGKRKAVGSSCASCGEGAVQPLVPEGWDPELTRSERPRLSIVGRPVQGDEPRRDHKPGDHQPEQGE